MALTLERYKKEFVSLFNDLATHRRRSCIFSDWLEAAALYMHQLPYNGGKLPIDADYERLEQRYMECIVGNYDRETIIKFGALLKIAISAIHHYETDFLGQVFMQEDLWCRWHKQHFTPKDVANLIAQLSIRSDQESIDRLRTHIERYRILEVHEPACGAGSLMIAFAEQIAYLGYDPRVVLQFHAIDIDRDCFNMCYIQLAALGLQAVVYHGDTLTLDIKEHRPTMGLRFYDRWLNDRIAQFEKDNKLYQAFQRVLELERQYAAKHKQPADKGAIEVAAQDVPALPTTEVPPYVKARSGGKLVQLSIFFDPAAGAERMLF